MPGPTRKPSAQNPPRPSSRRAAAAKTSVTARPERLVRIAQYVADGQIELPLDLPTDELLKVVELVRQRRRQNLLSHVARCIAADITRSQKT